MGEHSPWRCREGARSRARNHQGVSALTPRGQLLAFQDGLFSLLEVECLGACANAPMVQMNDDYYECLTPATVVELIEACKAGKPPPMGKWGSLPMNGQVSCEGPKGKTSLKDGPPEPPPMRTDLEPKVDPASVKAHMNY